LHGTVPSVLDVVIGTTWEELGNVRPSVRAAILPLEEKEEPIFGLGPISFLQTWVQVVYPSVSQMFASAVRE
jgi:hypothetical protein